MSVQPDPSKPPPPPQLSPSFGRLSQDIAVLKQANNDTRAADRNPGPWSETYRQIDGLIAQIEVVINEAIRNPQNVTYQIPQEVIDAIERLRRKLAYRASQIRPIIPPAPPILPPFKQPLPQQPPVKGLGPSLRQNQLAGLGRAVGFGPEMPGRVGGTGTKGRLSGGMHGTGVTQRPGGDGGGLGDIRGMGGFGGVGGFGSAPSSGWGDAIRGIGNFFSGLFGGGSQSGGPLTVTVGPPSQQAQTTQPQAADPAATQTGSPQENAPQSNTTPAAGTVSDQNGNSVTIGADGSVTIKNADGTQAIFRADGSVETTDPNFTTPPTDEPPTDEMPDPEGGDPESGPSSFYFHSFRPKGSRSEGGAASLHSEASFADVPTFIASRRSGPTNDRGGTNPHYLNYFPDPDSSGPGSPRSRGYFPSPDDSGGGSPRSRAALSGSAGRARNSMAVARIASELQAVIARAASSSTTTRRDGSRVRLLQRSSPLFTRFTDAIVALLDLSRKRRVLTGRTQYEKPNPEDERGPRGPAARSMRNPSVGTGVGRRTGRLL